MSGRFLILTMWPWPDHLAFLHTCFLISEMGCGEDQVRCGRFSNIENGHCARKFYCCYYHCKTAPEVQFGGRPQTTARDLQFEGPSGMGGGSDGCPKIVMSLISEIKTAGRG